jgi:hypothetical protein
VTLSVRSAAVATVGEAASKRARVAGLFIPPLSPGMVNKSL